MRWAGDLKGAAAPTIKEYPVSEDCYIGQIMRWDVSAGGIVEPCAVAAAGPDTTSYIAGIVSGVITSPSYNATYRGDKATYDASMANQLLNSPVGPARVKLDLVTPTTLIKAPIVKDTIGTAPATVAVTTAQAAGLVVTTTTTIDTSVSQYSTVYCRSGANKGQYRKVTTGATTDQTVLLAFTYATVVGDVFVVANIVEGAARIDLDSQFQGIDSSDALTYYYSVYVHELNLETAGEEYAIFSFNPRHFA